MIRKRFIPGLALVAALVLCVSTANADLVSDTPITVPADNSQAFVEFISQTAAYEGNLYFLGTGTPDQVLNPAPNTDAANLGQFLFNNHAATPGDTTMLIGTFDQGDILHLAYDIVHPVDVADELFRTDVDDDQKYFSIDVETGIIGIEDLRKPQSDLDYDDILFRLYFVQIPSPGVLALLGVAGLTGGRRRRRQS